MSIAAVTGGLSRLLVGPPPGLERWIADRYGVDAALLVDSGTSALRIALEAIPSGTPRRVALPAYGCYDLVTAAVGANAEILFYDLDPATLAPEWSSLSAALAGGATAVVVVHQYGVPVDLDRARVLCDGANALLIEDAAQGTGGWWRSRRLGAWGDVGILSFGRGKGMTAGGGGAVLVPGVRGAALMASAPPLLHPRRGVASWVKLVAQGILSSPELYAVPARMPWLELGDTPYHAPWAPRSIASSQAGALPVAVELGEHEANARRELAAWYGQALGTRAGVQQLRTQAERSRAGWLRFPVLLEPGIRQKVREGSFTAHGVMPGYPVPLPMLPVLSREGEVGRWPGAERLCSTLMTLPTHRWVTADDRAWIADRLA